MLLLNLNLLATAQGGVARLRELILTLAVQGKLVPQDPNDEPASELLKKIRLEKDRLIAAGKIKRDKPLVEISEEEKPFGLPMGWEWGRMDDISVTIVDCPHSTAKFVASGLLCIDTNSFKSGKLLPHKLRYVDEVTFADRVARLQPLPGDLVFAREGSVGESIIIPDGVVACLGQRVMLFRFSEKVSNEFVRLAISSNGFVDKLLALHKGIGAKHVNVSDMRQALLPLPPLAEQSRIVTRVEELMDLCDALEVKGQLEAAQHAQLVSTLLGVLTHSDTPAQLAESWQRVASHFDLLLDRPQAVDALEQAILQLAVRGLLVPQDPQDEPASTLLQKIRAEKDKLIADGKIKRDKPLQPIAEDEQPFAVPQGWCWVRVGGIGVTQTGGTPTSSKPEYFDGNFPFIGPGQITPAGKILSPEKFISELGRLESAVAEPGDILMVCIGGSIGKCAAASYPTAFNQQINCVHPLLASSEYVLNAMATNDFMATVVNTATGSATPIISKGKWDLLLLPLPPLAEQSRIVTRVAQLRHLCAELRTRLSASHSTQAKLAEALVQEIA
jgi:type I restriction enzyme, S subunit